MLTHRKWNKLDWNYLPISHLFYSAMCSNGSWIVHETSRCCDKFASFSSLICHRKERKLKYSSNLMSGFSFRRSGITVIPALCFLDQRLELIAFRSSFPDPGNSTQESGLLLRGRCSWTLVDARGRLGSYGRILEVSSDPRLRMNWIQILLECVDRWTTLCTCTALSSVLCCSWLCSGVAEGDALRCRPEVQPCALTSRLLSNDSEIISPPDGWANACGGSQSSAVLALMGAASPSWNNFWFYFASRQRPWLPCGWFRMLGLSFLSKNASATQDLFCALELRNLRCICWTPGRLPWVSDSVSLA